MIYDSLENFGLYFRPYERLYRAISFAQQLDKAHPDGKIEIESENIFAIIMRYQSKPADELVFETHKKYIDIQLVLEGEELIDVSVCKSMKCTQEYSIEKDVTLWQPNEDYGSLLMRPGRFTVLYPQDIHRTGRCIDSPEAVRKMVIKVCL